MIPPPRSVLDQGKFIQVNFSPEIKEPPEPEGEGDPSAVEKPAEAEEVLQDEDRG